MGWCLKNNLSVLQLVSAIRSCACQRKVLMLTTNLSRLSDPMCVISFRDQACAGRRNIYRHKTVSHPVVVLHMFWFNLWLLPVNVQKQHMSSSPLSDGEHWSVLLFISFITFICTIQLIRTSIPFITVVYTVVIVIKKRSLHNKGMLYIMICTASHQSILHQLRFSIM